MGSVLSRQFDLVGYHGSARVARPHVGFCITDDCTSAESYALDKNAGRTVTRIGLDTRGLKVEDVPYDFDAGEPRMDGVKADVARYEDSDMRGRPHTTWMLLTPRAVKKAAVLGHQDIED